MARHAGLSTAQTLGRFCGAEYRVETMGFAPGFAYLGGLDPALHVPRHDAPRPRIEPGSVAIAGARAGVYPLATPGGWRILGRTPLLMFDAARQPPTLLEPDARVRFRLIGIDEFERLSALARTETESRAVPDLAPAGPAWARVRFAGQLTTIQDLGRFGHESIGVSRSGAADPLSHAIGQRLVGNLPHAASLEMTLVGAQLEILSDTIIALTGAPTAATLELRSGRLVELAPAQAVSVGPGEILRIHALGAPEPPRGLRTYLSVRGGIAARPVLGSRSTHLTTALGPPPLKAGDLLHLAGDERPDTPSGPKLPPPADEILFARATLARRTLRCEPGPHARPETLRALEHAGFTVDARSDRVGVRLTGEALPGGEASMLSVPTARGDVQLPPSGLPIMLSADAPTTGGYPVIARVIDADLPILGQLRPGELVALEILRPEPAP